MHHQEPVAIESRRVDVVGHDDHRQALVPVQGFQQVENGGSVFHVQIGRGLVKEEDLRLLGQCPGDMDPLFLSAAQICQIPGGQEKGACRLHGLSGDGKVPLLFELQTSQMGRPAHENTFIYLEMEKFRGILSHKGHRPGQGLSRNVPDIPSLKGHHSPAGNKNSTADSQQCGFPRAVGPDNPQKFSLRHVAGEVSKNPIGVIAKRDVFEIQKDHDENRPFRNR
nr:hypothetical protein [Syntrophus gentianae]